MRKIITFLGIRPQLTQYQFNGQVYAGQVFAEAMRQFETYDQMLVCATDEATEKTWPVLAQLHDERIVRVPIPNGQDTDEMWVMFSAILEHVAEGDQVIFDITHGLRSLPFLIFLFAAYLKSAKNVRIEAIYYGAFELGNSKMDKPAPVIDLSEFVQMLDWITATSRFVDTGDGQALAKLLKDGIPPGERMKNDLAERELGNQLRHAAEAIDTISLALRVTRPVEVMESTGKLAQTLDRAMPAIQERVKPFALLASQIAESYGQFALEQATQAEQACEGLLRQRDMIRWYLKRRQVVQAATLAREWVISFVVYQLKLSMFDSKTVREPVETALNNAARKKRAEPGEERYSQYTAPVAALPQIEDLCSLWNALGDLRNDIAHCGMRLKPRSVQEIKTKVERLGASIDALAATLPVRPA